jgi:RNA polymerase sigma factor (sigma-70 family)
MATGQADLLLRHLRRLGAGRSDRELLQCFAESHDQGAFAELVERHGAMVLRVCRNVLQHQQDAEDAFQATFLLLARKAGTMAWGESVAPWLHGVARHVALKARAAAACRRRHEGHAPAKPPADPFADLTVREAQVLLDEELGRLPDRYRGPLVHCYLQGQTQEEAARLLGWSKATVRRRLERGRDLLRNRLGRRGLTLTAALCAAVLAENRSTAAVPPALVAATSRAAVQRTSGIPVAGPIARLLAEGGRTYQLAPWKIGAALLLSIAAVGAVLLARPASEETGTPLSQAATEEQPRPAPEMPARTDRYGDPLPAGAVARLGALRLYHGSQVNWLVFSPDGKLVVSTGMDRNRLWETATGRELPLKPASQVGEIFAFRGQLLAAESDQRTGETRLRDLVTGKEVFAAAWEGGAMHIRDLARDKELSAEDVAAVRAAWKEGVGPRRGQDAVGGQRAVSPDGTILATVNVKGKEIRLQDARTEKDLPPLLGQPVEGGPMQLTFSPDGRLLASAYAGGATVGLWDLGTRKQVRLLQGKDYQVFRTLFSPDGKLLAGADGSSVTLWDVATGKPCHDFGHTYRINALAFAPDGRTLVSAATYTDAVIRLWDPLTGRQKDAWRGHQWGMDGLAIAPDGRLVASAGQDGTVRLWEFATGKEVRRLQGRRGMAVEVAFAPDGKTLASAAKGIVQVWDVASGQEIRAFDNLGRGYPLVTFSRDGKTFAVGDQGETGARLCDLATGKIVVRFGNVPPPAALPSQPRGRPAPVARVVFAPDGKPAATTSWSNSDGVLRLWDLPTGRELRQFVVVPPPTGRTSVFSFTFSPDGRTLAAGYADRTVRLWEVVSGQERASFEGHRAEVSGLAFSPDGSLLASGSIDRTILVWDVTGERLPARPQEQLDARRLGALWADLASNKARPAYQAEETLWAAGDQCVPYLEERLHPAVAVPGERLARLLTDLDSDQFAVREKASRDLLDCGDAAETALRKILAGQPSPELRRRAEALLEQLDPAHSSERLRELRAVEVLEHVGSPAARAVLEALSKGAPDARLTRDARAALDRLARRSTPAP